MKSIITTLLLLLLSLSIFASDLTDRVDPEWQYVKSKKYLRITDCIIRDIDDDKRDEVVIASFSFSGKTVDVYDVNNNSLQLIVSFSVPQDTIFYDIGDIDNDSFYDIAMLTPQGLYYHSIARNRGLVTNYNIIKHIKSEIVAPQPELLTSVPMIVDFNNDGKNELVVENVRSIEIYRTADFKMLSSINLETVLEFSIIPGEFYPHYIFYTLPIILIKDIDNDGNKEILTKFPRNMNIFSHNGKMTDWKHARKIKVDKDNVYFLSDSFVKFSFPVIEDIDNNGMSEIIISTANLDMPRIRFEAEGDIYHLDKRFNNEKRHKITIKGIPVNLPAFFNISDPVYKDLICPVVPFNLVSIFSIISGSGGIKVPFYHYKQTVEGYSSKADKIFSIEFRIENVMSFVEELPLDQYEAGKLPDFYYFSHNQPNKQSYIEYYYHNENRNRYENDIIATLNTEDYKPYLPATLKIGNFTSHKRKDVVFILHSSFYILTRK